MALTKRMHEEIADAVMEQNPVEVAMYKNNHKKMPKRTAIGYLCGQAMKMSEGMCDPVIINDMIKAKLD